MYTYTQIIITKPHEMAIIRCADRALHALIVILVIHLVIFVLQIGGCASNSLSLVSCRHFHAKCLFRRVY
jgi:hypothetical protein